MNLDGCDFLDVEGMLTLLDSFKRRRERGGHLAVVASLGQPARFLRVTGLCEVVSVFPSEDVALLALRGGGPPREAPSTWEAARTATVALWQAIGEVLDEAPPHDILYHLTSMTALCERSEAILQEHPWSPTDQPASRGAACSRCQFCPLFQALGGAPEDVGCQRLLDPIIKAICVQDRDAARKQVAAVIRTLEEMPLPMGDVPSS